ALDIVNPLKPTSRNAPPAIGSTPIPLPHIPCAWTGALAEVSTAAGSRVTTAPSGSAYRTRLVQDSVPWRFYALDLPNLSRVLSRNVYNVSIYSTSELLSLPAAFRSAKRRSRTSHSASNRFNSASVITSPQ